MSDFEFIPDEANRGKEGHRRANGDRQNGSFGRKMEKEKYCDF
jgi:hypothetical protein